MDDWTQINHYALEHKTRLYRITRYPSSGIRYMLWRKTAGDWMGCEMLGKGNDLDALKDTVCRLEEKKAAQGATAELF